MLQINTYVVVPRTVEVQETAYRLGHLQLVLYSREVALFSAEKRFSAFEIQTAITSTRTARKYNCD